MSDLVIESKEGLYCAAGDFFIDPRRPVQRAVITHAHADHATAGHRSYYSTPGTREILRRRTFRTGSKSRYFAKPYEHPFKLGAVKVSFHPAGHVPGSAQIRLEHKGEVWVITGDWKRQPDGLSEAFTVVPCDTLVTESTFALPVYRWQPQDDVFADVVSWITDNQQRGITSVIVAYAFGKAQRIIFNLDRVGITTFCHGTVDEVNQVLRASGYPVPQSTRITRIHTKQDLAGTVVIAPSSALGSPWVKRLGTIAVAHASGWMQARGTRRRKGAERGFVLSDHADWYDLLSVISETNAQRVIATHGYTAVLARYVAEERGLQTGEFVRHFMSERDND